MVNAVDRICDLLNKAKAKAGNRGRLKAKGVCGEPYKPDNE